MMTNMIKEVRFLLDQLNLKVTLKQSQKGSHKKSNSVTLILTQNYVSLITLATSVLLFVVKRGVTGLTLSLATMLKEMSRETITKMSSSQMQAHQVLSKSGVHD